MLFFAWGPAHGLRCCAVLLLRPVEISTPARIGEALARGLGWAGGHAPCTTQDCCSAQGVVGQEVWFDGRVGGAGVGGGAGECWLCEGGVSWLHFVHGRPVARCGRRHSAAVPGCCCSGVEFLGTRRRGGSARAGLAAHWLAARRHQLSQSVAREHGSAQGLVAGHGPRRCHFPLISVMLRSTPLKCCRLRRLCRLRRPCRPPRGAQLQHAASAIAISCQRPVCLRSALCVPPALLRPIPLLTLPPAHAHREPVLRLSERCSCISPSPLVTTTRPRDTDRAPPRLAASGSLAAPEPASPPGCPCSPAARIASARPSCRDSTQTPCPALPCPPTQTAAPLPLCARSSKAVGPESCHLALVGLPWSSASRQKASRPAPGAT